MTLIRNAITMTWMLHDDTMILWLITLWSYDETMEKSCRPKHFMHINLMTVTRKIFVYHLLSLRTIVHVYKVVHKFHIKVLSLVNRFIGVCQFEIWISKGIDVNSCKEKIIRYPPSLLVKVCHVISTLRSFTAHVWLVSLAAKWCFHFFVAFCLSAI